MTPAAIKARAAGPETLIIEGAMGLFDGAPPAGKGATADLARILGLPVVLIVDAAAMAQSVAPLVSGFANFAKDVEVAGVILNNVGSPRHEKMLRDALTPLDLPVLGAVPRHKKLARPSRHLGLVQAGEMPDLEGFINAAADIAADCIDLDALLALGRDLPMPPPPTIIKNPKRIALAQDVAFAFSYPHQIKDWIATGATILPFSPLANDAVPAADLVFLPGGYPELHAARLAASDRFLESLRKAAQTTDIYGECGGYMTLGQTLTDADGVIHQMAGLLDLDTSFAARKLHLGYRNLTSAQGRFAAHEFHYATTLRAEGRPLFQATDAAGADLGSMGLIKGRVSGSFAHIIDRLHTSEARDTDPS